MLKDSGHKLKQLNVLYSSPSYPNAKVDGGLSQSEEMMQVQADVLTISIHRPEMTEITALGAAIAAGFATGVWKDLKDMESKFGKVHNEDVFTGRLSEEERKKKWELWEWGVERSYGWVKGGLTDFQEMKEEEMN